MSEATQVVAIDGPAGAGKSTAARKVAEVLGFAFLDTGAMYRAATWRALHHGLDLDDVEAMAASTEVMDLKLVETATGLKIIVDGVNVTDDIRTPEVTRLIYKLDQNPKVRARLVELQREFGEKHPTVAEGRDIGTVVFPKAKCKIFLDASLNERARRRAKDLEAKGIPVDMAALEAEIHERDEKTRNRAEAPLRPADDAVILDTTNLSFQEAVEEIVRLARNCF